MAGRGRASTLPAWMTSESSSHAQPPRTNEALSVQNHYNRMSMMSGDPGHSAAQGPRDRARGEPRMEPRDREREDPRRMGDSDRGREREDRRRRSRSPDRRARERDAGRSRDRDRDRESRGRKSRSRSRERRGHLSPKQDRDQAAYEKWKAIRENRKKQFDIPPPPGSDGMPAAGFPISCMATLPVNLVNNPLVAMGGLSAAGSLTSVMQQTKNARRLYVGGIPAGTEELEVTRFFNDLITKATGGSEGACPVLSVYINHEKCFAFVELNSVELTTACCQLDGIEYKGKLGNVIIRVRRPNDFRPELLPPPTRPIPVLSLNGITAATITIPDGPNKIYIGNLPLSLGEEQVRELLEAFGPLRAFQLVKDPMTGAPRGYGYCEYADPSVTNIAVEGLNNMPIGDKTLTVRLNSTINTGDMPLVPAAGKEPTKVILLTSLVTREELIDVSEYEDIVDDVRHECSQYGTVVNVIIPRTIDGYPQECEGSVYVEFATTDMAKTAAIALSGRKFADRTVIVDYFDEEKFARRIFV